MPHSPQEAQNLHILPDSESQLPTDPPSGERLGAAWVDAANRALPPGPGETLQEAHTRNSVGKKS